MRSSAPLVGISEHVLNRQRVIFGSSASVHRPAGDMVHQLRHAAHCACHDGHPLRCDFDQDRGKSVPPGSVQPSVAFIEGQLVQADISAHERHVRRQRRQVRRLIQYGLAPA